MLKSNVFVVFFCEFWFELLIWIMNNWDSMKFESNSRYAFKPLDRSVRFYLSNLWISMGIKISELNSLSIARNTFSNENSDIIVNDSNQNLPTDKMFGTISNVFRNIMKKTPKTLLNGKRVWKWSKKCVIRDVSIARMVLFVSWYQVPTRHFLTLGLEIAI